MDNNTLQKQENQNIITNLIMNGDLSGFSKEQQFEYVVAMCKHLKIDHLRQPIGIYRFNTRTVAYLKKEAGYQLASVHGISCSIEREEIKGNVFIVKSRAISNKTGRFMDAIGVVKINDKDKEKDIDNLDNLMMIAQTRAHRRAILSLLETGLLDESELDTMPKGEKNITPAAAANQNKKSEQKILPDIDKLKEDLESWYNSEYLTIADVAQCLANKFKKQRLEDLNPEQLKQTRAYCGWLYSIRKLSNEQNIMIGSTDKQLEDLTNEELEKVYRSMTSKKIA